MSVCSLKTVALALALAGSLAQAQNAVPAGVVPLRDPTLPPPAALADTAAAVTESNQPLPLRASGATVLVREGKPYLVVGTRLVGVGQRVEGYKIERITESEIWLRDDSGLSKVARFAGVQRQPHQPQCAPRPARAVAAPAKPAKASTPKKTASPHRRPTRENEPHDC